MAASGGAATISSLAVEITASAQNATNSVEALQKSLEGLKSVTSTSVASLQAFSDEMQKFVNNLPTRKALNALSGVVQSLSNLNQITVSTQNINSIATGIASISGALDGLNGAQKFSGLVRSLKQLPTAIQGFNTALNSTDFDKLEQRFQALSAAFSSLQNLPNLSGFVNTLKQLPTAIQGFNTALNSTDFDNLGQRFQALTSAMSMLGSAPSISGFMNNLRQLPTVIQDFNKSLQTVDIDSLGARFQTLFTAISRLGRIPSISGFMNNLRQLPTAILDFNAALQTVDINSLGQRFQTLSAAISMLGSVPNISGFVNNLRQLPTVILDFNAVLQMTNINDLGQRFQALSVAIMSLQRIPSLSGFINNLKQLPTVIQDFNVALHVTDFADLGLRFQSLSTALAPLQNIPNLSGLTRAISDLPQAINDFNSALNVAAVNTFAQAITRLHTVLQPLAQDMRDIAAGMQALPASVRLAVRAYNSANSAASNTNNIFLRQIRNLHFLEVGWRGIQTVVRAAMGVFERSNAFEEALNLAEVAMNDGSRAAINYAEKVERLAGIDMTQWITNVSEFNQILEGFGIAGKTANSMSKNLTQLGYDIQSAFNVSDVNTVMQRLASGITGQVRGMRTYGVELTVAAMQEWMLKKGIDAEWKSMTQAQKAAARYAKIMETTSNIQGDLARTIATPTNALRILSNMWNVAQRYMGQFVSVIAARLIPVVQTAVSVIGALSKALANMWGYTLPSINYTGMDKVTSDAEDAADAVSSVGSAAGGASKDMKGLLADWDELNIIQSESGGGGGGGGASAAGLDVGSLFNLDSYDYDFLSGLKNQTDEMYEKFKEFLPIIETIGGALLAWKIADSVADFFGASNPFWGLLAGGVVLEIGLVLHSVNNMLENGLTLQNVSEWVLGTLFGSAAIGVFTRSPGAGFRYGFAISLTVTSIRLAVEAITTDDDKRALFATLGAAVTGGIAAGLIVGNPLVGFTAFAGVMLGITLTRLYWQNLSKARQSFRDAFGDIGLSKEEVQGVVDQMISTSGVLGKIKMVIDGWANLETARADVENMVTDLNSQVKTALKFNVDTTPETVEDITEQVKSVTKQVKENLLSSNDVFNLTTDILFGENSEEGKQIQSTNAELSDAYITYCDRLAKKFNDYLAEAMSDGNFDLDEKKIAAELYNEWLEAINLANNMMTQTTTIAMGYQLMLEGKLDKDTVDSIAKELDERKDTAIKDALKLVSSEKVRLEQNVVLAEKLVEEDDPVNLAENKRLLKEAQDELAAFVKNEPEIIVQQQAAVELEFSRLQWNVYGPAITKYAEEIYSKTGQVFESVSRKQKSWNISETLGDLFADGATVKPDQIKQVANTYVSGLMTEIGHAFSSNTSISTNGKELDAIWQRLLPSVQNDSELMAAARAAGEQPAAELIRSYTERMKLGAEVGNKEASEYVLGMMAIDDADFNAALSSYSDLGASLPKAFNEGYVNSISIVQENGSFVLQFANGIKQDVDDLTPEMIHNLKQMGLDINNVIEQVKSDASQEAQDGVDISGLVTGEDVLANKLETPIDAAKDLKTELKGVNNQKTQLNKAETKNLTESLDNAKTSTSTDTIAIKTDVNGLTTAIPPSETSAFLTGLSDADTRAVWIAGDIENALSSLKTTIPAAETTEFTNSLSYPESEASRAAANIKSSVNGLHVKFNAVDSSSLTDSMRSTANSVESYAARIAAAVAKANSTGVKTVVPTTTPTTPQLTVPTRYAGGGTVPSGQLFIAREEGPEMVGIMGGSTTVANNDQIVSGIASGVASANAEQNNLLRQQNEYLRRLLEKDLVIQPSATLGRVNEMSEQMYARTIGG